MAEIEKWQDGITKGIFSIPLHGRQRANAAFKYEILGIVRDFLDTFEVKEVDLDKEMDKEWNKCEPIDDGMGLEIASIEHEQFDNIAKHFFELGLKAAQKGE